MFTKTKNIQSLQISPLWRKIQDFKFDADDAVITFAGKLAAQNNWSARFTNRAIEEYRRFVFYVVSLQPALHLPQWWIRFGISILPICNRTG